jgi:hypothetical protein
MQLFHHEDNTDGTSKMVEQLRKHIAKDPRVGLAKRLEKARTFTSENKVRTHAFPELMVRV